MQCNITEPLKWREWCHSQQRGCTQRLSIHPYWMKQVRQREIAWCPIYVESKKKWDMRIYLQNTNSLTDLENKLMVNSEEGCGDGMDGEFGMVMYTLLYLKWITNKDLLYRTWNSAWCYGQPEWEGSLEENGFMCMYGWIPSLFAWNCHNIC